MKWRWGNQKRPILVFCVLLAAVGTVLLISSKTRTSQPCEKPLKRFFSSDGIQSILPAQRSALYLITNAHVECRPCLEYAQLKKMDTVAIEFRVPADFTDIDIENFRDAFDIAPGDSVQRIPQNWVNALGTCAQGNQFILFHSDRSVMKIPTHAALSFFSIATLYPSFSMFLMYHLQGSSLSNL